MISDWFQVRSWRQPTPNWTTTECCCWFCTTKGSRASIYFNCYPSRSWEQGDSPKCWWSLQISPEQRRRRYFSICVRGDFLFSAAVEDNTVGFLEGDHIKTSWGCGRGILRGKCDLLIASQEHDPEHQMR